MFDFQEQYEKGWAGEQFLLDNHDFLRRALPGERRFDLIDKRPPFKRVEVKTDFYPHGATPSFFMERGTVVNGSHFLLGGPWRAARDGVDVFIYLYANAGEDRAKPAGHIAYWFNDVPALVARLDKLREECPKKIGKRQVRSLKVTARGYLYPRDLLLDGLTGVETILYQPEEG